MLINIGFLNGELLEPKIDFDFEIDGRFDISEILLNYSDEDFMNFINDKNEAIIVHQNEQSYDYATNDICKHDRRILSVLFEAKQFKDSLVDNDCIRNAYDKVYEDAYVGLLKLLVLQHKIYDTNSKKIGTFTKQFDDHVFRRAGTIVPTGDASE